MLKFIKKLFTKNKSSAIDEALFCNPILDEKANMVVINGESGHYAVIGESGLYAKFRGDI